MTFQRLEALVWCRRVPHLHTHYILLLLLHSFNGLFSRTTWVSRHQKSRTILVKPIWIYWSKRQWVAVASAGPYAICTSPQIENHARTPPLSFLQVRCRSCRPTNSVKALSHTHVQTYTQSHIQSLTHSSVIKFPSHASDNTISWWPFNVSRHLTRSRPMTLTYKQTLVVWNRPLTDL